MITESDSDLRDLATFDEDIEFLIYPIRWIDHMSVTYKDIHREKTGSKIKYRSLDLEEGIRLFPTIETLCKEPENRLSHGHAILDLLEDI